VEVRLDVHTVSLGPTSLPSTCSWRPGGFRGIVETSWQLVVIRLCVAWPAATIEMMAAQVLRLRPFVMADEVQALAAHQALKDDDFTFLLDYAPGEAWDGYLTMLEARRAGLDLPEDRVASSFLAAVVGERLVGRVSVRHRLNEWLALYGGHIGYGVVPCERRKGYATEILRQALVIARAVGVDDVLVVCNEGNVASARTIEACGGRLESVIPGPDGAEPQRRYWIS
jgi:predicted acetyltransferase